MGSRCDPRLGRLRWRGWSRCFDYTHLAVDIVTFDATIALDHAATSLKIHTRVSLVVFSDQCELLRTAETTSKWETALLRVPVGLRVPINAERALSSANALSFLLTVQSASHSIVMARGAVIACATCADEESD